MEKNIYFETRDGHGECINKGAGKMELGNDADKAVKAAYGDSTLHAIAADDAEICVACTQMVTVWHDDDKYYTAKKNLALYPHAQDFAVELCGASKRQDRTPTIKFRIHYNGQSLQLEEEVYIDTETNEWWLPEWLERDTFHDRSRVMDLFGCSYEASILYAIYHAVTGLMDDCNYTAKSFV